MSDKRGLGLELLIIGNFQGICILKPLLQQSGIRIVEIEVCGDRFVG